MNLSFFTFGSLMKKCMTHIAILFLMMIFIIKVLQPALPFLSARFSQQDAMEAMAETEAENAGEQNKAAERELIGEERHGFEFQLSAAHHNKIKFQSDHTTWSQNAFVPVFTPPPEQA
ncbi:MAG: hypothetical protein KF746_18950 [Chitinophagaceae bacterium]|nr:hypothetical protein [Chitinophagaceae bacterium]